MIINTGDKEQLPFTLCGKTFTAGSSQRRHTRTLCDKHSETSHAIVTQQNNTNVLCVTYIHIKP